MIFSKCHTSHITHIKEKASFNILKLYRFKSAPLKIKRRLYSTLIRPILEYPAVQINESGITNRRKLQRIQNKATRFITNSKLLDRRRSETLHNITKLTPVNIRYNKLAKKQLYKIYENYYQEYVYINKATDYEITTEPKQQKQQSLMQRIEDIIFIDPHDCPWHNPALPSEIVSPDPIFT